MAENDENNIPKEIPPVENEVVAPVVKKVRKAKAKKIKGGKLVLVESPTKVKTIKKYLGSKYKVMATKGHIKDLPKSKLGIDIEHDFAPHYIVLKDKRLILSEIKKEIKTVDEVYLATDPDREGEAIGWHVAEEVKKFKDKKIFRVLFNEITKTAVTKALENPREINMNLVDAQQGRRILDRLVGYKLSPLLWNCLLYTSPSPRDRTRSRMPSSA